MPFGRTEEMGEKEGEWRICSKDDFFFPKERNKSGKGFRKYVVCTCVCRVRGLQFKEREQNRPPWKNNTEVKA